MREQLVEDIVRREWAMFGKVHGLGGRAACQEDPETFAIMRRSQALTWPDEALESWRDDLETAERDGRNLLSEKYAWMMEDTFPQEFLRIRDCLAAPDAVTLERINEMTATHVQWKREAMELYPLLAGRGRILRTCDAGAWTGETSFETYIRGEFMTYSARTVALLHGHTLRQRAEGINAALLTLEQQVRQYGYATLEEAEERLRARIL